MLEDVFGEISLGSSIDELLGEALIEKRFNRERLIVYRGRLQRRQRQSARVQSFRAEQQSFRLQSQDGSIQAVQPITNGAIAIGDYAPRHGRGFVDGMPHLPRRREEREPVTREVIKVPILFRVKILDAEGLPEPQLWLGGDRPPLLLKRYEIQQWEPTLDQDESNTDESVPAGRAVTASINGANLGGEYEADLDESTGTQPIQAMSEVYYPVSPYVIGPIVKVQYSFSVSLSTDADYYTGSWAGSPTVPVGSEAFSLIVGAPICRVTPYGEYQGNSQNGFAIMHVPSPETSEDTLFENRPGTSTTFSGTWTDSEGLNGISDLGLLISCSDNLNTATDPLVLNRSFNVTINELIVWYSPDPTAVYLAGTNRDCYVAVRYYQGGQQNMDYMIVLKSAEPTITSFTEAEGMIAGDAKDWRRSLLTFSDPPPTSGDACTDEYRKELIPNIYKNIFKDKLYSIDTQQVINGSTFDAAVKLSGVQAIVAEQNLSSTEGVCQAAAAREKRAGVTGLNSADAEILAIAPYTIRQ